MKKLVLPMTLVLGLAIAGPAHAGFLKDIYNTWTGAKKEGKNPWFHYTDQGPKILKEKWGIEVPEYREMLEKEPPAGKLKELLKREGLQKIVVYQEMVRRAKNFRQLRMIRDHIRRWGVNQYGGKLSKLHQELYEIMNEEIKKKDQGEIRDIRPPASEYFERKEKGVTQKELDERWQQYKPFWPKEEKAGWAWMLLPLAVEVGRRIITRGL